MSSMANDLRDLHEYASNNRVFNLRWGPVRAGPAP